MSHVQLYPRIIVSNSHGNTTKYVDTVTIFQKLNQKFNDPKMTFNPTSIEVICVTLPKDHCIKSHENMSKYVEAVTLFSKKLEQKVTDP